MEVGATKSSTLCCPLHLAVVVVAAAVVVVVVVVVAAVAVVADRADFVVDETKRCQLNKFHSRAISENAFVCIYLISKASQAAYYHVTHFFV